MLGRCSAPRPKLFPEPFSQSMSARRPRRRQDEAPAPVRHPLSDIRALGLITVGALLFLSLYTYTPDDVPPRFSIASQAVPNDPVLNAIGPFGAVIGGYTIFLFGAAAFLLPACLIWLGMSRILMPKDKRYPPMQRRSALPIVIFSSVLSQASTISRIRLLRRMPRAIISITR